MREYKSGDWFYLKYGSQPLLFYVLNVTESGVFASTPHWCVSSRAYFPSETMANAQFAGVGRKRWWWGFLPFRDVVCPFTVPKGSFAV